MSRVKVSIINESTVMDDEQVAPIVTALQNQVNHDFLGTWGEAADLIQVPKGGHPQSGTWWLCVLDDSDQAGALGYHDLTTEDHPIGKVFAATDQKYGAKVSVTMSHELLEMLGDAYLCQSALDPKSGRLYAYENCDAVEADDQGYERDGVTVSDFVLRQWFDSEHRGKGIATTYTGKHLEPFELAAGGYISYIDLSELSKGWQQVSAQESGEATQVGEDDSVVPARVDGQRDFGFPDGSRRERRRRKWHGEKLVRSTAHSVPF